MKERLQMLWVAFLSIMLSPRMKSLTWAAGAQLAAQILQVFADNLSLFELTEAQTVFIGLLIQQATKALNNKWQGKSAGLLA